MKKINKIKGRPIILALKRLRFLTIICNGRPELGSHLKNPPVRKQERNFDYWQVLEGTKDKH